MLEYKFVYTFACVLETAMLQRKFYAAINHVSGQPLVYAEDVMKIFFYPEKIGLAKT